MNKTINEILEDTFVYGVGTNADDIKGNDTAYTNFKIHAVNEAKVSLQALVEEALREVIGEAEAPIVNDPVSDHDRVILNRLREIEQQGRIPQVISKMFGDK